MMEELDKKAKKEMLDELQRAMKQMMLEDKGEDSDAMPIAAEVSVMKAEPLDEVELEDSELPLPEAPALEIEEIEAEDEDDVDFSDPAIKAKFKEFLKMQKETM